MLPDSAHMLTAQAYRKQQPASYMTLHAPRMQDRHTHASMQASERKHDRSIADPDRHLGQGHAVDSWPAKALYVAGSLDCRQSQLYYTIYASSVGFGRPEGSPAMSGWLRWPVAVICEP